MNRKPMGIFQIIGIIALIFLALFALSACQSNEFFDEEATIVKIEVIEDQTEEPVATITDQVFISSLTEELESARTSSTANLDMVNPDYKLLFLNKTDKVVREMSYYIEEKTFGVIGRYHYDGELIAVVTELPIE
ncbi:hypothetical protein [Marinilactibacillus sp. Marseille-P9653]|uniref:hypothetical protein n=1 Tax=Marinilactibacillus sp. Marseille-P9653 TaxID=2866583 RepID=UPI001CE4580D|nr:hypothetical protein [Marinilactibacillus sp. Marseille-P9653]